MFDEDIDALRCDGSETAVDALIDVVYSLKGRVDDLAEIVSDQQDTIEQQQELMDVFGEFLQTDSPEERLAAYIRELEETVESQDEIIERKDETIDEYDERLDAVCERFENKHEEQQEQIDSLENELAGYREDNELDKAHIRKDVKETDDQSQNNLSVIDTVVQKVKGVKSKLRRVNGGRSSLEQLVMLPNEIAHQADLSKNQLRARRIAMDLHEISTAVPAGTRVRSSDIKEKLRELSTTAHDQTVSRIMDFLNDFAEEQCERWESTDLRGDTRRTTRSGRTIPVQRCR